MRHPEVSRERGERTSSGDYKPQRTVLQIFETRNPWSYFGTCSFKEIFARNRPFRQRSHPRSTGPSSRGGSRCMARSPPNRTLSRGFVSRTADNRVRSMQLVGATTGIEPAWAPLTASGFLERPAGEPDFKEFHRSPDDNSFNSPDCGNSVSASPNQLQSSPAWRNSCSIRLRTLSARYCWRRCQ